MTCPKCRGTTEIRRTTPNWKGRGTHRERRCLACHHKFETIEVSIAAYDASVRQKAVALLATLKTTMLRLEAHLAALLRVARNR